MAVGTPGAPEPVCEALAERIKAPTLEAMTVRMWEHEHAWAAYRKEL